MDKFLMPNESPEKRLEYLKNTADSVVKEKYYEKLSEKELGNARAEFTSNRLKMDDIIEQKKDVMSQFKEQLKPLEGIHSELSSQVRQGFIEIEGTLYKYIENNMAYFYNNKGELIETKTRPANVEEIQNPTIHMAIKTGTDN